MGRFWIGVILLVGLLILGFWVSAAMDGVHQEIADTLEQAARFTFSGETARGVATAGKARAQWQRRWHTTASVADHAPMDEIDSLFAQMDMYEKTGNYSEFTACCHRIAKLVRAVGEAHALNWWNLL